MTCANFCHKKTISDKYKVVFEKDNVSNAQAIKVYKNNGTTPVATYLNSATDKYEVAVKGADTNLLP